MDTLSSFLLIFCLLGGSAGRPPKPVELPVKPAIRLPLPPGNLQDQTTTQTEAPSPQGQFLPLDTVNPVQENVPFIFQVPQLHTFIQDQQTQMSPTFSILPLPSIIPQQPGVAGIPYFTTTPLTGPLADTDVQSPVYTVVIQQPLASGSVSSEEGLQQPMVYSGVLMAMIPEGQNMGIKNGGGADEETPDAEALLPDQSNPNAPDPAPQENDPAVQGGPVASGTVREPLAGVRQDARSATRSKTAAPCTGEVAQPTGPKATPSPKPRQAVSWLPIRMKATPWGKGQNRESISTTAIATKSTARPPVKPTHRGNVI